MLWGKKLLWISAAVVVAFAAAHTAERLKASALERSLGLTAGASASESTEVATRAASTVPKSASLSSSFSDGLVGITPVAATTVATARGECDPELRLAAVSGAMIHVSLAAPCNRGERIVVRHSGLSFALRTGSDGHAVTVVPALKSKALVAVYLQDSRLVLGEVSVPEAESYSRFAVIWETPTEMELRVAVGEKVLVGSNIVSSSETQKVMALGSASVQSPVLAQVYSTPGLDLGIAEITGEVRITPATCGRKLRVETVSSAKGIVTQREQMITVPLCGTAGDILVLKNLAPGVKVSPPK